MVGSTELQKLKEEYPEFFKKTPAKLIDFILSEETSSKIADICVKNGVGDDDKIEGIAYRIVLVLLNKLPKENLALTLESGVGLTAETAKKVAKEANQFISSARAQLKLGETVQIEKELPKETIVEEKPKRPPSKDAYREKIE